MGPAGIAAIGGSALGGIGIGPAGIALGGMGIGPAGIALGGMGIGPAGIAKTVHAETRRTATKATFKISIVRVRISGTLPGGRHPAIFCFHRLTQSGDSCYNKSAMENIFCLEYPFWYNLSNISMVTRPKFCPVFALWGRRVSKTFDFLGRVEGIRRRRTAVARDPVWVRCDFLERSLRAAVCGCVTETHQSD